MAFLLVGAKVVSSRMLNDRECCILLKLYWLKLYWRESLLLLLALAAVVVVFQLPPLAQDPSYHQFFDARTLFGVANFCNVSSNLAFVCVGLFGLWHLRSIQSGHLKTAYLIFCSGICLIGLGSAYYHYEPTPNSLVWDRLPMTIAFMALFVMVLADRVNARVAKLLLWPLLSAGLLSVAYWYWTELNGQGDLRAYVLIQFSPMLLIPVMLLLFAKGVMRRAWLWGTIATYGVAKVAEHFDEAIFHATGMISGHSIKHMLGAVAVLWVVLSFPLDKAENARE